MTSPRREPSPLNRQPIDPRGPFFQGWLVRTIDHENDRSIMLIVASFSASDSATYDQHYVFCAVTEGGVTRTIAKFPEPASVTVSAPALGAGLDVRWTAEGFGSFHFTDELCVADFTFDASTSVSMRVTNRRAWRGPRDARWSTRGPEGWLGYTDLLPSRYFIHSVGSDSRYSLQLEGRSIDGTGHAHMECNHGNMFPRGWVWSEAIGPGNDSGFSLVLGKIAVGPIEPFIATFHLRRRDGRAAIFRTTDFDHVRYDLDGVRKVAKLELSSRFTGKRATVRIEATEPTFHKVFVPTAAGMSDDPGCVETYTAVATITYADADGVDETYTFPRTAFEFGGEFVEAVQRNATLDA